jgi:hypothetical protein
MDFPRSCLFIGGAHDGLTIPASAESLRLPVSVIEQEKYIRESLSVGGASIAIYRHESLTPKQVLDRVVEHYKAWAGSRPGSRR